MFSTHMKMTKKEPGKDPEAVRAMRKETEKIILGFGWQLKGGSGFIQVSRGGL
jgi:hypothetical protein